MDAVVAQMDSAVQLLLQDGLSDGKLFWEDEKKEKQCRLPPLLKQDSESILVTLQTWNRVCVCVCVCVCVTVHQATLLVVDGITWIL